jgi:hypothetical protein
VGALGGAKADTENMRQNPDLATAAVIVIAAGNLEVGGTRDPPPLLNLGFRCRFCSDQNAPLYFSPPSKVDVGNIGAL